MVQDEEHFSTKEHVRIKTILVVEDDRDIGEVLVQAILQETSYLPVLVGNGLDALNTVKNIKPHLFILDYKLPRMNGIDLYDQLHHIREFSETPTIMMSAHLPKKDLGTRDILAMHKPIDLDDLLQAIEELLT